jgi:hypothetical protein
VEKGGGGRIILRYEMFYGSIRYFAIIIIHVFIVVPVKVINFNNFRLTRRGVRFAEVFAMGSVFPGFQLKRVVVYWQNC